LSVKKKIDFCREIYRITSTAFIFLWYSMKLIVCWSIEKKGKEIWISFDEIYTYIKDHRKYWMEKLCSPLPDTVAYKWYVTRLHRIIVFMVTTSGIIYPVYIGDKHDELAKNITVHMIRNQTHIRQKAIEKDIQERKIKIRHF